ncbi:Uncharacterised protein [uncultured archaeon]|nr:Uncharacterised protein [uncultured archaeon]
MTSECVVDAELFKKYCLHECGITSCEKYSGCKDSLDEVIVCLIETETGRRKSWIIKESKCLDKFLDFIDNGKCILYYNNHILSEYDGLLLPEPLLGSLNSILSNDQHAIKKEGVGGLIDVDFNLIEESDALRSKRNYLDLAASLCQRTIISTKEDKENVYHPTHTTGLSLRIECKNVCEMENKIRIEE